MPVAVPSGFIVRGATSAMHKGQDVFKCSFRMNIIVLL